MVSIVEVEIFGCLPFSNWDFDQIYSPGPISRGLLVGRKKFEEKMVALVAS